MLWLADDTVTMLENKQNILSTIEKALETDFNMRTYKQNY